jgi:hypothetical protein
VAIRLKKGIGNETKERKWERKGEVKEINNVISRISGLQSQAGHCHNSDISCQPMQQNSTARHKIRYGRIIRRPLKLPHENHSL